MDDILSQIIAYAPDRINTETKARALVPGPRNMYSQGQLVKPNADGSRPGYYGKPGKGQPPSLASKEFITFVKSLDNDVVAESTIDDLITNSGVDIKRDTAMSQLRNNHPDIEYKKTGSGVTDPETKLKIQKISEEKLTTKSKQIKNINDWTDKWYKKNAKNFTSYDDLKTNLIKDWAKEVKNKKYSGPFKLSLENGLPNISAATAENSKSLKVANKIFDLNLPVQRANKELIFKKGFANFKLQDPIFKQKINDYFDLIILDKRAQGTQQELIQSGKLKEGYGLTRTATGDFTSSGVKSMKGKLALDALNIDKEVLDFVNTYLKPNSAFFTKTGGENIYDILNKHIDPTKVTNYRNKISMGVDNWRNNLNAVVDLANRDLPPSKQLNSSQLLSQMKNESNKMAKLFGLKDLPPELKFYGYSQDHLLGIREALELGDSKIARQTLKTIVGTTRAQNTFLGFKEFGNKRRKLIKDFNAAPSKARGPIVQKLNDLTKKFIPDQLEYSVKKDGSMKIKVLQPQKTQRSRIQSYEIEKGKLPKKLQQDLLKLAGTANKKCKGLLSYGGRVGLAEGLSPEFCINEGRKVAQKALFEEGATPAQKSIARRLISTGGKIALSMLNPKELIRLSNLVGPGALGLMGLYEAGSITDDVLRLNKPLDEALAGNWLTKSFLPYSEEFAKQKNLLQSGQLTGDQKEYALEMMKMENFVKEGQRIEGMAATQLLDDSGYGNIDGSPMIPKEEMNKAYAGMFGRLMRMQPYMFEEGITGRGLENEAAMNEYQDSRLAKTGKYTSAISEDKFRLPGQRQIKQDENYEFASSPIFGGPQPMVNKAPRPKNMGRGPMTEKNRMNLDLSIPGYTPYDKTYTPTDEETLQIYRSQGIVPPTTGYLAPGEGTKFRMGLASQGDKRSIYGSKFMEGGIASLNVNKK